MKRIRAKTMDVLIKKLKVALQKAETPLTGSVIADGSLHIVEVDEDVPVDDGSDELGASPSL